MFRARTLFSTAVLALTTAYGVAAQAGVADLRYVFPLPTSVVFTAIDTMESTVTGMHTGESKTTTTMQTVNVLHFAPDDSGIAVTAALRSFSGLMATAMGDMSLKSAEVAPMRFHIDPKGAGLEPLAGETVASAIAAPQQVMGKMRASSGLFPLPGRQLRLGESWSDTDSGSGTVEGMTVDKLTRTTGTYVADSVIDGRTLNVLRVIMESTSTTSGTLQGMEVAQTSSSKSEEFVLWDSSRHIPVSRSSVMHIDTKTELKQINMTTRTVATFRKIITGEAQN